MPTTPTAPTVFHVLTWMESANAVSIQLGLEGAISNRPDAERVRDACHLLAQETILAHPRQGTQIRVGILEIEAPSVDNAAASMHITCTNVDAIVDDIQQQINAARAKRGAL